MTAGMSDLSILSIISLIDLCIKKSSPCKQRVKLNIFYYISDFQHAHICMVYVFYRTHACLQLYSRVILLWYAVVTTWHRCTCGMGVLDMKHEQSCNTVITPAIDTFGQLPLNILKVILQVQYWIRFSFMSKIHFNLAGQWLCSFKFNLKFNRILPKIYRGFLIRACFLEIAIIPFQKVCYEKTHYY